jgi:WbqC-like protein family
MKRIAILQSNYIPWKGYFDIIASVDEFIVYDEVQYTKNDWRNRNIIKTPGGTLWLTIPVRHSGRFGQSISETRVSDRSWARKHWQSFVTYYSKAGHFGTVGKLLQEAYAHCSGEELLRLRAAGHRDPYHIESGLSRRRRAQ